MTPDAANALITALSQAEVRLADAAADVREAEARWREASGTRRIAFVKLAKLTTYVLAEEFSQSLADMRSSTRGTEDQFMERQTAVRAARAALLTALTTEPNT